GRVFDGRDTASSPRVFVISRGMATTLFGDDSPIGRRLVPAGGPGGEIVGVVADVKSVLPEAGPVTFQLYQSLAQEPRPDAQIAVRTDGVAPATVVDAVRNVMTEIDPDLPVRWLRTADANIDRAVYTLGVLRDVLIGFAVLGLFLATLGIYGVIARTMAQRSGEFAIRFALGARAGEVTRLVLGSGLKLALLGSAFGLFGALGVFRLLAAGYPGMRFDGVTVLAATTLLLVAVSLLACWLPARRAARIDPIVALRAE